MPGSGSDGENKQDKQNVERYLGVKLVALDWAKDRKLVCVDLASMNLRVLKVPLLGWLEAIIGLPNQQKALLIYKNEIA